MRANAAKCWLGKAICSICSSFHVWCSGSCEGRCCYWARGTPCPSERQRGSAAPLQAAPAVTSAAAAAATPAYTLLPSKGWAWTHRTHRALNQGGPGLLSAAFATSAHVVTIQDPCHTLYMSRDAVLTGCKLLRLMYILEADVASAVGLLHCTCATSKQGMYSAHSQHRPDSSCTRHALLKTGCWYSKSTASSSSRLVCA